MSLRPYPLTLRPLWALVLVSVLQFTMPLAYAQSALLITSNEDFALTAVRSDIGLFSFNIELDVALVAGMRYENPPMQRMDYRIIGDLVAGTPSGFTSFDLQREFEGNAFYEQGSSLVFEISPSAVLDDGVQLAELAGESVVLLFDGRESATGRFHPARLELRADGTGQLLNSNNQPGEDTGSTIAAGSEYIIDLAFDPGNTTVLSTTAIGNSSSDGIGASVFAILLAPWLLVRLRRRRHCWHRCVCHPCLAVCSIPDSLIKFSD